MHIYWHGLNDWFYTDLHDASYKGSLKWNFFLNWFKKKKKSMHWNLIHLLIMYRFKDETKYRLN